MKKFLITLAMVAGILAQAATTSTSMTAAATNSVVTTGARITLLTLANAGTNTLTVKLFDAPSTNLTYALGEWSYYSNYLGNVTNTFTNAMGIITNAIYTNVMLSTSITNAATTNSFATLGTVVVPAGETIVVPYTSGLQTYRGLLITNSAPGGTAVFTVTYSSRF